MSIYTAKQYISYRLRAMTRHGIHSPFVYGFIEQVLMNTTALSKPADVTVHGDITLIAPRYALLTERIKNYCSPYNIWIVPINEIAKFTDVQLPAIHDDDVAILPDIHTTPANTLAWTTLQNDSRIKLSIDLYGVGALFFKKEFKEKQHFVLKY